MANSFMEFKFDVKQLVRVYEWLDKFDATAKNPEVMDIGVKYLGQAIDRNFRNEGTPSFGGQWDNLSLYTQLIRSERGYPPAHPILVQSGTLRDVTAGTLSSWGVGTGRATVSGQGIRMAAWTGQLSFTAKISGPKVENQYGGTMSRSGLPARSTFDDNNPGYLPARPFFGLTHVAAIQAREAIVKKIMSDWARKSGTTRKV